MKMVCINGPHDGASIPPMPEGCSRFMRLPNPVVDRTIITGNRCGKTLASLEWMDKQVFKPEQIDADMLRGMLPTACAYRLFRVDKSSDTAYYVFMGERPENWQPEDEPDHQYLRQVGNDILKANGMEGIDDGDSQYFGGERPPESPEDFNRE